MQSDGQLELGLDRLHVDGDFQGMIAPPQDEPAQWTYIPIIPAPGERHMAAGRNHVVGGIDVQPTCARAVD